MRPQEGSTAGPIVAARFLGARDRYFRRHSAAGIGRPKGLDRIRFHFDLRAGGNGLALPVPKARNWFVSAGLLLVIFWSDCRRTLKFLAVVILGGRLCCLHIAQASICVEANCWC